MTRIGRTFSGSARLKLVAGAPPSRQARRGRERCERGGQAVEPLSSFNAASSFHSQRIDLACSLYAPDGHRGAFLQTNAMSPRVRRPLASTGSGCGPQPTAASFSGVFEDLSRGGVGLRAPAACRTCRWTAGTGHQVEPVRRRQHHHALQIHLCRSSRPGTG